MKSTIIKRSITLAGYRTSISLEEPFWNALRDIAYRRRMTLSELVETIDANRKEGTNLSSAIRMFVLQYFRDQLAPKRDQKPDGLKLVG